MRRLPYENWLKYLVCTGMGAPEFEELCAQYGLLPPGEEYVDYLKEQVGAPLGASSTAQRMWFRKNRVVSLFLKDPNAITARSLLQDRVLRPTLEKLLVGQAPFDEIPTYIMALTGKSVSEETCKMYAHYFCNRSLLSEDGWKTYIVDSHEDPGSPEATYAGRDWEKVYRLGHEYALWTEGYRLRVDAEEILDVVIQESTMRFLETGSMPNTRETATTASLWHQMLLSTLSAQKDSGKANKEILNKLRQISMQLDESPVETIQDLARDDAHSRSPTES